MNSSKSQGLYLLCLILGNCLIMTIAYPQVPKQLESHYRQVEESPSPAHQQSEHHFSPVYQPAAIAATDLSDSRKYSEKPNVPKKVALDDIDNDVQTNQIQDSGFSWTSMLSTLMQMFFAGGPAAPTKSDDLDYNGGFQQSPWTNVLTVGIKIIRTLLGGAQGDGIDKVDNGGGASPMQTVLAAVISSVIGAPDPSQVNTMAKQAGEFISMLLDALKTSFSHRSLAARSLGKRDSVSDAAVASIVMLKGYAKTYQTTDDKCLQKYICQANTDCVSEIGANSIFCQLGTYVTSFVIEKTAGNRFESLYEAGRRGRSGDNCKQVYLECNEV